MCSIQADHFFDEINATLLRVTVPEQECFNDQLVEDILTNRIEEFINRYDTQLHCLLLKVFDNHDDESTNDDPFAQSSMVSISKT